MQIVAIDGYGVGVVGGVVAPETHAVVRSSSVVRTPPFIQQPVPTSQQQPLQQQEHIGSPRGDDVNLKASCRSDRLSAIFSAKYR